MLLQKKDALTCVQVMNIYSVFLCPRYSNHKQGGRCGGARDKVMLRNTEGASEVEQIQAVSWRSISSSWNNKTFAKVDQEHFQSTW